MYAHQLTYTLELFLWRCINTELLERIVIVRDAQIVIFLGRFQIIGILYQ